MVKTIVTPQRLALLRAPAKPGLAIAIALACTIATSHDAAARRPLVPIDPPQSAPAVPAYYNPDDHHHRDDRPRDDDSDTDNPSHNKLGFRLSLGRLPLAERAPFTFTLGVGIEHAIFTKWRVLAEYEWMWLMEREPAGNRELTFVGHGHRLHAGLRRAILDKRALDDAVKLYIDVELGGGIGLATDDGGATGATMDEVLVVPHGFLGLRAGYTFGSDHHRSSKTLEAELHLRAIAVEHGAGLAFGVGWLWGD